MSNEFNVDAFMTDLDSKKDSAGSLKMWRLNMDRLAANQVAIMKLPLQARVCVKAIVLLSRENQNGNFSMTVPMIADKAVELGLDTRQPAARIVRYYMSEFKKLLLDSVK